MKANIYGILGPDWSVRSCEFLVWVMLCTYRRRNGEEKLAVACVKVQWSFEDEEGLMGAVQGELAALVTGDDGILDVRVGRVRFVAVKSADSAEYGQTWKKLKVMLSFPNLISSKC